MEGGSAVGSGIEDPDADPLTGPRRERPVVVLVGVAVEDHRVGVFRVDLVDVHGAALGAEVELGLQEDVFVCYRRQIRWVDDDGPEQAVGDVGRRGHARAVVHPDAGLGRSEGVDQRPAGRNGPHRLVGRQCARVEGDGVTHARRVDQGDLEDVADRAVEDRPGERPVVGPQPLGDARGDLADDLLEREGLPMDRGRGQGWKVRRVRRERGDRRLHEVEVACGAVGRCRV